MSLLAGRLGRDVGRVVRKAALAADQAAVTGTPVDTGRARANWFASVGSPSSETREPIEQGEPGSDARGAVNAQAALDQSQQPISRFVVGKGTLGSIFLTNNTEYIGELEAGKSMQAPEGMAQQAVEAAAQVVRRARVIKR
jgi:hypothetical protein